MIWVVILMCFSLVNCIENKKNDDELIFTQIIFRHGDRTIRKTYSNDPYKDKIHWPEGFSQLTKLGKHQQYNLGKFLRRRYETFIGTYSSDKIGILSSGLDRSINSATVVLAALFPPRDNQIWKEDLLWQPIAVHSIPIENDYLITGERACKRYVQALKAYENSTEIRALKERHRELFEYLEENAGQPVRTLEHLKDIHGTLDVEHRLNKTLPEWARKIFIPDGAFEYLANYWLIFTTGTTELKRLKSGFLLKDILTRFKSKTESLLPDALMQIYSGHDITIGGMLNSLGIFELHLPPCASSLIFELYKSNDGPYVQFFYRNSTAEDLTPMNIPNCGTKCSLIQLYELYKDILPSDFETECRLSNKVEM